MRPGWPGAEWCFCPNRVLGRRPLGNRRRGRLHRGALSDHRRCSGGRPARRHRDGPGWDLPRAATHSVRRSRRTGHASGPRRRSGGRDRLRPARWLEAERRRAVGCHAGLEARATLRPRQKTAHRPRAQSRLVAIRSGDRRRACRLGASSRHPRRPRRWRGPRVVPARQPIRHHPLALAGRASRPAHLGR